MGATQGQLFQQPVWDPRPAGWRLGCLLLDYPGSVWAATCLGLGGGTVWPAEGACELLCL